MGKKGAGNVRWTTTYDPNLIDHVDPLHQQANPTDLRKMANEMGEFHLKSLGVPEEKVKWLLKEYPHPLRRNNLYQWLAWAQRLHHGNAHYTACQDRYCPYHGRFVTTGHDEKCWFCGNWGHNCQGCKLKWEFDHNEKAESNSRNLTASPLRLQRYDSYKPKLTINTNTLQRENAVVGQNFELHPNVAHIMEQYGIPLQPATVPPPPPPSVDHFESNRHHFEQTPEHLKLSYPLCKIL